MFPNLEGSKVLSIDIETRDDNLKTKGLGAYRKDGYILGVSINNGDGYKDYIDLRHKRLSYIQKNVEFIRYVMGLPVPKLFANGNYDLTWMKEELDIVPNPNYPIHDILVAEPLLNENLPVYSLDSCAQYYLGKHKEKSYLEQRCKDLGLKGDFRKHLYLFSHEDVKPYALGDTELPIEIFRKQYAKMHEQNLLDLYYLELEVQRISREMTARGVRINTEKLPKMIQMYEEKIEELHKWINRFARFDFNPNATAKEMQYIFDREGWEYQYNKPTKKMQEKGITQGNPSFTTKYLLKPMAEKGNEFCEKLIQMKTAIKTLNTFLIGGIQSNLIGDRIHGQFNPLKRTDETGSDAGAVTGRFSSSHPNLQNLPSKDELSKLVRTLFIPEVNHYWCKADYKQIEIRVLLHFAMGEGADIARMYMNKDPEFDYHQWCSDMTGIPRKFAKNLNFGLLYGMGVPRMVREYGFTLDEARAFKRTYARKLPYLNRTNVEITRAIKKRGYVKTILGRRRRLIVDDAYKGLNAVIQGTAADIFKQAMVDADKKGLFDVVPLHIVVHDEDDVSVPYTKEGTEALRELQVTMQDAIKLKVPVLVGCDIGKDWGSVEEHRWVDGKYEVIEKDENDC